MSNVDFQAIKQKFDLLCILEEDLGPGKKSGDWMMFHCPFTGHRNNDRKPSLCMNLKTESWYCFGCGSHGDVIDWLQKYRKMSLKGILAISNGSLSKKPPRSMNDRPVTSNSSVPPSEIWQARGWQFIEDSERNLWEGPGRIERIFDHEGTLLAPLEYLKQARGLNETTIRSYKLGYSPSDIFEQKTLWGMESDSESKRLLIPRGIVIPWISENKLWGVNIRTPDSQNRYKKIAGSKSALFGLDNLLGADLVMLVEGEFDCMLASQCIGDIVGVATLGSATNKLDLQKWGEFLVPARSVLVVYDADKPSSQGLNDLLKKIPQSISLQIPVLHVAHKDLSDYILAGGNFRSWLTYWLEKKGIQINHNENKTGNDSSSPKSSIKKIELNPWGMEPWKIDPTKPCYACGHMDYRPYKDGSGYVCNECHPPNPRPHYVAK